MPLRIAVLTISDTAARGERAVDGSGDALVAWAGSRGYELAARAVVADDPDAIGAAIARWADDDVADLVVTTGGTGLTARDTTPEATRAVLDKEAPGISEALRMAVYPRFPRAALSRGIAGVRARTLVVNLPGSTGGVIDGVGVLDGFIEHAVDLVREAGTGHGPEGS